MIGYDFRITSSDTGGTPQPTIPGLYPGLWWLWSADRFVSPEIDYHMGGLVAEAGPKGKTPPDTLATHRMFCCDVEGIHERMQVACAGAFIDSLRKFTQAKCLIIGGAWPGVPANHMRWNYTTIVEELKRGGEAISDHLSRNVELYSRAGVLTYHLGAGKPEHLGDMFERGRLLLELYADELPGLERCLWVTGHWDGGIEWTTEECNRVLGMPADSFAVYHGPTQHSRFANMLAERVKGGA
jgi:hypothetical protein